MNERIRLMKESIQSLNHAGVRRTTYYIIIAESIRQSAGEPVQIRRAKGIAYLLDNVEEAVLPYELIAGSITGMWPLEEKQPVYEEQKKQAISLLEKYISEKSNNRGNKVKKVLKTFDADFNSKEHRWAMMLRDHSDANIDYHRLQELISEMREYYSGSEKIKDYEIGRELERYFKYDYGDEINNLIGELPWFPANHLALDYDKALKSGLGSIRSEIEEKLLASSDNEKKEFYSAAKITIDGVIRFIYRYSDNLLQASRSTDTDAGRSVELELMAENCRKIAEQKPGTFYEAVQLLWMLHLIANMLGGTAISFSRFDQYMFSFYKNDVENNVITRDHAKELLCCLWLKVNEPNMRTVQSLTIGGITPEGTDAANDLTRLCLEVTREIKLPYPNIGVRINKISPQWLLDEAVGTMKAGIGQPMLLNDEIWIANLKKLNYPEKAANDYYNMGCVEIMIPGKQPNWGVTDPIGFPMLLEPLFKKWEEQTISLDSFDDFLKAYLSELKDAIYKDRDEAIEKLNAMKGRCYDPFASIFIENCIEKGLDLFHGGSVYPMHWSFYADGLGTTADSLAAVKKFVYDEKKITVSELNAALKLNFKGFENMQSFLDRYTPAYGNDIDATDELAAEVFNTFTNEVFLLNDGTVKDKFVSTLFSYTFHVYQGEITGATPNGRRRGEAFSDAMGASQGKDTGGPTKLLNSVLKLDHSRVTGAYALNLQINPYLFKDSTGTRALASLLRAYISGGGPQIQVNFYDLEAMKDAKLHPEKHRDLIVRVGGYCEYFVNLDGNLQNEIIQRTLQEVG